MGIASVQEVERHAPPVCVGAGVRNKTIFSFVNNQASATDVTGVLLDSSADTAATIRYAIKREGTADLFEHGRMEATWTGAAWDLVQEYSGDDSGVSFSMTAAGQLQYTSTDNAGSSSELMYIMVDKLGD